MHIEFFVEEPSAEEALKYLVPRILAGFDYTFEVHTYRGKPDLLKKLPLRLRAYRYSLSRLIVLIDRDDHDCMQLKQQLNQIVREAGLIPKSDAPDGKFQVVNRIAIKELEAWFFGDVEALCRAYPRLDPNLANKAPYRDPDAIRGGTWEALERELKAYHRGGLEKVRLARDVAQHMNPDSNRSKSFQVFRDVLRALFDEG